jgi:hypothetical protein
MSVVTKVAAVENANAIWEYDPTLPENRVLGRSLDIIAAIQTLGVKVTDPFQLPYSFILTNSM